jgi:hypothetical protein
LANIAERSARLADVLLFDVVLGAAADRASSSSLELCSVLLWTCNLWILPNTSVQPSRGLPLWQTPIKEQTSLA